MYQEKKLKNKIKKTINTKIKTKQNEEISKHEDKEEIEEVKPENFRQVTVKSVVRIKDEFISTEIILINQFMQEI